MKESLDSDVVLFRTEYKDILEELAGENTILGAYKSLAPEPTKLVFSYHTIIYNNFLRVQSDDNDSVFKFLILNGKTL